MSCPAGFEAALGSDCRVTCPPDFKYIQSSGVEKCVSVSDNRYFVVLRDIPKEASPSAFVEEQSRFVTSFIELKNKIAADAKTEKDAETTTSDVKANDETTKAYAEALSTLEPLRPPTQPHVDIETAKLDIKHLEAIDLRILQICLLFIVITLLEYFLLPTSIVHGVAFFTMCVGLSSAFYLSNK